MRYGYLDDFRRSISVFAIFSYGNAVLGTPPMSPSKDKRQLEKTQVGLSLFQVEQAPTQNVYSKQAVQKYRKSMNENTIASKQLNFSDLSNIEPF